MGDSSPGRPAGKRGIPRQGVIVETARGVERHLNVHGTAFMIPERYNHVEVIGKGSYGMVCSAKDSYRRTAVAIKKITPMSEHSIDAKRALREVRVMRYLGAHENIVTLEDLFSNEENDELYIVMELLESDLHRIIQSPQTLSTQHHRVFMLQILRGVKFLHENGIIHRDLKPGNILVTRNCEVRISDFGLARAKPRPSNDDQDLGEVEAMTEHVITRWYRPPELMLSPNGFYGFSVDIWSIGCIFGELIGRRPLFPGTSFVDQLCLIFDVIGAPTPEEVEYIQGAQARKFLREKEGKDPVAFEDVFPGIDTEAASLLKDILVFDPDKRCTAGRALLHPFFSTIRAQAVPRNDAPEDLDFKFEHKRFSRSALKKLIAAEVDYFQSGANLRVHSTRTYTGTAATSAATKATKAIRHPAAAGSPPEGTVADHRKSSGAVEKPGSETSPYPVNNGGHDHYAGDWPDPPERGTQMRGCLEQAEGEREDEKGMGGNLPGGRADDCVGGRGVTEKPGSEKCSYSFGEGDAGHAGDSPREERVRSDCAVDSREVQAATVSSAGESEQGTRSRDTPSNEDKAESGGIDSLVDTTLDGAELPRPGQYINQASAARQSPKEENHSSMAPIELELGRRGEDNTIAATPKETTAWHPFFVPSWRLRSTPVRQSSVAGFAAGADVWDSDHAGWVVDRWGRWSRTGLRTPAKLARVVSQKKDGDEASEILKRRGITGKTGNVMNHYASRMDQQLPAFNRSNSSSEMLRRERSKRAWDVLREANGRDEQVGDPSVEPRQSAGDCSGPRASKSGAGRIGSSSWNGIDDRVESSATNPCYPLFTSQTSRRQFPSIISASIPSTDKCQTTSGDKLFQRLTESEIVEGSTVAANNESPGSSNSSQPDPEICEQQRASCTGHEAQVHALHARSVVPVSRDAVFDSACRHGRLNSPRNRAPKSTISAGKSPTRIQRSASSGLATNEIRAPIASVHHHPGNLRQSMSLDGDIEEGGPLSLASSYGSPPAAPPPLGVHLIGDRRKSIRNSSMTQTLAGAGLFSAKDSKPGEEVLRQVKTKQDGRRRPRNSAGELTQSTASPLSEGHPLRRARPEPPTPLEDDDALLSSSLATGRYGGPSAAGRRASPPTACFAKPTTARVNSSLPSPPSGGINAQGYIEPTLSMRGEPLESPTNQDRSGAAAPGSSVPLLLSPATRQCSPKAESFTKLEHTVPRLSRSSSDISVVADRGKAGTVRFEEPPSVVERRAKKGYHARPARRAPTGRLRGVAGKAASASAPDTKAFNPLDPKIDWHDTSSRSGLTMCSNHGARSKRSFSAAPHAIDSGVPRDPERNRISPRRTVRPGKVSAKLTRSQQQRRVGSLAMDNATESRSWRAKDSGIVVHRGNIDDETTATAESKFRILQRLWEHSGVEKDVGEVGGSSPLGLNSRVSTSKAAAQQWAARGDPTSLMPPTPRTPVPRMETQGVPVYRSDGRPNTTAVSSDDRTTIATSRDVEAPQHVFDSNISFLGHKGVRAPNNVSVSAFSSASVPSTLVTEADINSRVQGTQARQRGQEALRVTRFSRFLPFRRFEFTGEDRSAETGRNEARQKEHREGSRQAISGVESFEEETHGAPIAGELGRITAGSSHESGWRDREPKESARRNERLSSLPPHPGRDKPEQRAGIQAGILRKMRSFPKRRRAKINPSL